MIPGDAVGDFGIGVGGSIRMFLARERKNDTGIIIANRRKLVRLIPCPHFKARPVAPEVDSVRSFDDSGDVGAANAGGDFDEIKLAAGVRPKELRMGHSAHEAEPLKQIAIDFEERFAFFRLTRKRARGEYAALMRGIERRRAIGMGVGEDNTAFCNITVNVIDGAVNELLKQIKGLLKAHL